MSNAVYFSDCLQKELVRRTQTNPLYSMRAFSRTLGVNVSILSRLLRRQTLPSLKTAEKIISKLDIDPDEAKRVMNTLEIERVQHKRAKLMQLPTTEIDPRTPETLDPSVFEIISDWHHYAILELTYVKGFKSDTHWIAGQLGITTTETSLAIERLLRHGLLTRQHGRLKKTQISITTPNKSVTNHVLKRRQKQILTKSMDALENVDISHRSHTAMTMAIDPTKIPEAKERVLRFMRELCEFLEGGEKSRVYELSVGLFPLQTLENEK